MASVSRGTRTGDFVHPFAQRDGSGEKASTLTRVPFDDLCRVESATTITVLAVRDDANVTVRRTVRGEY
jgi:hypothetical protein